MALFGLFGRRKRSKHVQDQLDSLTVEEKRERIEDRRTARELVLAAVEKGRPELADAATILRPSRGRPPLRLGGNGFNDQMMAAMMARFLEDPEERMERLELSAIRRKKAMRELLEDDDFEEERGPKGIIRELLPLAPLLALPLLANNPQAAAAIGPALVGMLGTGQQQHAPEPQPQPQQTVITPVPQPAIAEPTPPEEPVDEEEAEPTYESEKQSNVLSGLRPKVVLANLERMDPPTFVSWLLHQPNNEMILRMLDQVDTSDPQGTLSKFEGLAAAFGWGEVIAWLRANESKAVAIIEELRSSQLAAEADAGI